jgi:phage terminase large subunit
MQLELQRRGMHVVHANNDVENGIQKLAQEMKVGNLTVCRDCHNTIRELEGYVWDTKQAEKGKDRPLKQEDHCVDALRYAIASHVVPNIQNADAYDPKQYIENRFEPRSIFY